MPTAALRFSPILVMDESAMLQAKGVAPFPSLNAADSPALIQPPRVHTAPEIGAIAEGQWADLLLLDANPLDDVRNFRRIREVIQGVDHRPPAAA